ncbi:hypothetical protein KC363_g1188 [Hortaea werneckii]|nr:hypothetical protein KC361_g1004 [Hortaea werneckii]KAI7000121.1 hypothetical protein KC359_g1397 [Hortaea werneckii]KAI7149799.1 hypothetical protein KC344_g666 [Hortaea werneckii]KAI7179508.1 hypothetical protein KC360_g773 [Hortaea werneckii]KAI7195902.1 hypothetical protein KC363_g1188 [Hortaea werneckii]
MVSLVSAGVEYILAEATRTMSLQYDTTEDPADVLWLGCCCFPRSDGLNDLAMAQWRKAASYRDTDFTSRHYFKEGRSEHWCIVSDVAERPEYQERAFAQRGSDLRFYCSVPLRGPNGAVLGALSIMDDRPRYGVSAAEMLFLEDSADTITEHLQTSFVRSQQQRSESFIQALGLFNCQESSLRDWWIGRDNDRIKRSGRYHMEAEASSQGQQDRLDDEFGKQENAGFSVASVRRLRRTDSETGEIRSDGDHPSKQTSNFNADANAARIRHGVAGQDFAPVNQSNQEQAELVDGPVTKTAMRNRPKAKRATASGNKVKDRLETFDLAKAIESTYARASNLVREAIHGEGAVFADARAASAAVRNRRGTEDGSTPSGEANSSDPSRDGTLPNPSDPHADSGSNSLSEGDKSDRVNPKRPCAVTGFSTRSRSTLSRSSSTLRFALTETELRRLIKRYPGGKIFNLAESGGIYSSSGDEDVGRSEDASEESKSSASSAKRTPVGRDAKRLSEIMVGARTIAFYPIWDDASDLFSSVLFVWSITPLRYFDPSVELNYLAAFGHSLTAELARLNALASEKAKGSFISSISHELRSPLHGVLAGAEFLQESDLTPYQQEMTLTITLAGRTLLNTVDQILDYSKISNRSRNPKRLPGGSISSEANQGPFAETFDLAKLTEEVVESVTAAHRFELNSRDITKPANLLVSTNARQPAARDLAVIVNVTKRASWWVNLSKGSWTRVITNLVGNALKYTKSGTVTVSLDAGNIDRERARVILVVQDTGVGMSKQFVSTDLFTPYKQADFDQVGTGLGLSIVKEIAKDLHAKLDCHSEPNKGTRMSMELDVSFVEPGPGDTEDEDRVLLQNSRTFAEFAVHCVDLEVDPSSKVPLSVLQTKRSVLSTAAQWLGCTTTSGALMAFGLQTRASVIAESDLRQLAGADPEALSRALKAMAEKGIRLFVLGHSVLSTMPTMTFEGFPLKPNYVHQPFGPRKIIRTIAGGETHPLPTSPTRSSTYSSHQKPTTPLTVRANGRSSEVEGDPSPWTASLNPIQNKRDSTSTEEDSQSPKSHPGLEVSQASPTLQPEPRPPLSASPSVASSAADSSKTGVSQTEQPPGPQNETNSQAQQAVLLVEDNNINMQLLKALMKKLKLPFDTAWNGREALDLWSANPRKYLMILTDISMPVMDGNEATAAIRAEERKRKLSETPIVAVTGVIDAAAKKASFDAGVNRWFAKPVKMKELSALVAEVRGEV